MWKPVSEKGRAAGGRGARPEDEVALALQGPKRQLRRPERI